MSHIARCLLLLAPFSHAASQSAAARRASTQLRSPTRTVAYPMKSPGESVVSITAGSVTLHNATLRDTIMALMA